MACRRTAGAAGTPRPFQFRGYVPGADGTYAFDRRDLFRTEPGRQAWLIRYGPTLAGFALTRPVESGGTSMYASFIVRGLRRHGVGLQSARELLRLIPRGLGHQLPGRER